MPSLKDRMAAFQEASSPDAFQKQNKKTSPAAEIKTSEAKKFVGQKTFNPVTPEKQTTTTKTTAKKPEVGKITPGKISSSDKVKSDNTPEKTTTTPKPKKVTPGKLPPTSSLGKDTDTPSKSPNEAVTTTKPKVEKKTPGKLIPTSSSGKDKPSTPSKAPATPGKLASANLSPADPLAKASLSHVTPKRQSGPVTGKVVENKPTPVNSGPKDWDYLYELSVQFDNFKAHEADLKKTQASSATRPATAAAEDEASPGVKKDIRAALEGCFGGNYTAKADWLNDKWISDHLIEEKKFNFLTFRLGDPKLFGRFDKTDEKNRNAVIDKFVNTLLAHPKAKEITGLDLSNCLLPDEFLEDLSAKVLKNPKQGLPKLQLLNLETNLLEGPGFEAIAQVIRSEDAWRYLQVLMLENQKKPHTSQAEEALADAIVFSPSIVACSFRVRGGLQRQQVNNTIAANIDVLRLARREHSAKMGTLKERKRNEMEQYFDKIAANDPSIKAVDLVGDAKFLSLNPEEKTKAGAAFANNTHVKTVKMVKLQLDDKFADAMGVALTKNNTIEKLLLDSNVFSGDGIKSIFAGMGKNSSVDELQVRHQGKTMASSDEEALPDLLEANKTIIKLGVDARNQLVKMKLDRKTNENREHQRKLRAQGKTAGS